MSWRIVLPLLGTAILSFAAVSAVTTALREQSRELGQTSERSSTVIASSTSEPEELVSPVSQPDAFYEVILARPLFTPTRRAYIAPIEEEVVPETSAPAVAEPTTIATPKLVLSGVLGDAGSRAVLLGETRDGAKWYRQDDRIGAWTISKIGPNWVELSADEQNLRLELFQ